MTETAQLESTARDFDFWHGTWNVSNRRLKRRLAGSDEALVLLRELVHLRDQQRVGALQLLVAHEQALDSFSHQVDLGGTGHTRRIVGFCVRFQP